MSSLTKGRSVRVGLALCAVVGLAAACAPATPGGGMGGGTGDTVKPTVLSVDVLPASVAPGSSFTISALVTDAVGVTSVAFAVRRNGAPAGFCSTTATLVSGTAQTGQWDLTCSAPAVVNSGTYQ
ncbi:MAG: Ig-like domain-containing protein, partial [Microthrixaceae bacterium]